MRIIKGLLCSQRARPSSTRNSRASQPAPPDRQAELRAEAGQPGLDLVSVPFQFDWARTSDPRHTGFMLNVQPDSVPPSARLEHDRTRHGPLVSRAAAFDRRRHRVQRLRHPDVVFSSHRGGGLVWGSGPLVSLPAQPPNARDRQVERRATAVVLERAGPWTFGALWTRCGRSRELPSEQRRPDLRAAVSGLQATRTLTLTVQSETTANWEMDQTGGPCRSDDVGCRSCRRLGASPRATVGPRWIPRAAGQDRRGNSAARL